MGALINASPVPALLSEKSGLIDMSVLLVSYIFTIHVFVLFVAWYTRFHGNAFTFTLKTFGCTSISMNHPLRGSVFMSVVISPLLTLVEIPVITGKNMMHP